MSGNAKGFQRYTKIVYRYEEITFFWHFRKMLQQIKIFIIKFRTSFFYNCTKMLFSSQDAKLTLSKTTSPQKLFPPDCITLYVLVASFSYYPRNDFKFHANMTKGKQLSPNQSIDFIINVLAILDIYDLR